jgi:hypothetical protein
VRGTSIIAFRGGLLGLGIAYLCIHCRSRIRLGRLRTNRGPRRRLPERIANCPFRQGRIVVGSANRSAAIYGHRTQCHVEEFGAPGHRLRHAYERCYTAPATASVDTLPDKGAGVVAVATIHALISRARLCMCRAARLGSALFQMPAMIPSIFLIFPSARIGASNGSCYAEATMAF